MGLFGHVGLFGMLAGEIRAAPVIRWNVAHELLDGLELEPLDFEELEDFSSSGAASMGGPMVRRAPGSSAGFSSLSGMVVPFF